MYYRLFMYYILDANKHLSLFHIFSEYTAYKLQRNSYASNSIVYHLVYLVKNFKSHFLCDF